MTKDGSRSPTFAPFFDDVWRVSPKMTQQLGVRWEYVAPWHEVNDIEGSFDLVSGRIAFHKVPANIPASLVPLVITQDNPILKMRRRQSGRPRICHV